MSDTEEHREAMAEPRRLYKAPTLVSRKVMAAALLEITPGSGGGGEEDPLLPPGYPRRRG
ncbi:MAG TPA: hypothetical protein VK013_17885 [Myxococcaceae bacterium]|nr:hypothetical protein [Myxococcaceae bacterium]